MGHLQFWLQDNFSGVVSRPRNWWADSPVENAFQGEPPCFSSNADFTENQEIRKKHQDHDCPLNLGSGNTAQPEYPHWVQHRRESQKRTGSEAAKGTLGWKEMGCEEAGARAQACGSRPSRSIPCAWHRLPFSSRNSSRVYVSCLQMVSKWRRKRRRRRGEEKKKGKKSHFP